MGLLDIPRAEFGKTTVAMSPGSPDTQLIGLSLSGEQQLRSQSPSVVSVRLDCKVSVPCATANPSYRVRAKLSWGAGKGKAQAIVDIKRSMHVSLEADALTIEAQYIGNEGPTVTVSAMLAYGGWSNSMPLTYTETDQSLAANASSSWLSIPSYAQELVVASDITPSSVVRTPYVEFSYGGTAERAFSRAAATGAPVPIPNGAENYRITNDGGGGTTKYTPIFRLAL